MMKADFPESPPGVLLRSAAGVDEDDASHERIRRASQDIEDWEAVIEEAEAHGLAPWLHRRLASAGASVPIDAHRQLGSLTLRHRGANRIRDRALTEMIDAIQACGADVVVLKGAALAHLVYEQPGLRPMSDVDLLVAPRHLEPAAAALRGLGYTESPRSRTGEDHHHLPALSRLSEGLSISVEIHHDAIAPDNIGCIRLDTLNEPPRAFRVGDAGNARALGHIDMLRHLWRHALQPRAVTKLGSALDIMLYASRFADDIDWPRVEREFPEIPVGLTLLGYLVPLPHALAPRVPAPAPPPPGGIGVGMPTLSSVRHGRYRAARLLNPSEWWLRAFYNVPPGGSLAYTRMIRHPARILFWLWRRIGR